MNKCNGSCCERFFISSSPAELNERASKNDPTVDIDIQQIAAMVIPIEEAKGEGVPGYWYTCKNWDTETRLCTIYETRPQMCRDFPYMDPCINCGWENQEYIEEKNASVLPAGKMALGSAGVEWREHDSTG